MIETATAEKIEPFKYTAGQQAANEKFVSFIANPDKSVFLLSGYAGTGKSTLIEKIMRELDSTVKLANLINERKDFYEVVLTATTNKAAEALAEITGREVRTIQSFLNLTVNTHYKSRKTTLQPGFKTEIVTNTIIFIDEASYIDTHLLGLITEWTKQCKIIYIGDPAQLTPIESRNTCVWEQNYPTAYLEEVVRQSNNNPIIDLATSFRNAVNTGDFFSFTPDGVHVAHLTRDDFDKKIIEEFGRPGRTSNDAKVLAWTNKTVIGYNYAIRGVVQGISELQVGDYAICNKYINTPNCKLKTDDSVLITKITPSTSYGVTGTMVEMNAKHSAFLPSSVAAKKIAIKSAKSAENFSRVQYIETNWIDLRAAYACTINKSQGSTYDTVFIDLDDIKKCNSANQIARMLYVAVSRARLHVFLTGDLV